MSTNTHSGRVRPLRIPHPHVYDLKLFRMNNFSNSQREIPTRVTLLRSRSDDTSGEHLFLDQMPMPRESWTYDAHDRVLTWRKAYGGGRLYMSHDGTGAKGVVGPHYDLCSVQAGANAIFNCSIAPNCGATYQTEGGQTVGLTWDTTSAAWQTAAWDQDRLQLTYSVIPGGPMSPPSFTFDFQDNETQAIPWDPPEGTFSASLSLGVQNGLMVWLLSFASQLLPDPDSGPNPATGPDSVYPYWMQAVEDSAAGSINGVLQIDDVAPRGALVGMQGVRASAALTGYYRTSPESVPFGVFDARMTIGGQPVTHSRLHGSVLRWQKLTAEQQTHTGLPESGALDLTAGETRRLSAAESLASIAKHGDLHPELHKRIKVTQQALSDDLLGIDGLLSMTPYVQNAQQVWSDAVQAAVTQDLTQIMNSFIPSNMWNLLFPGDPQAALTGELATIANTPVSGVSDPTAFYQSLATAVMTQGLANGSDPSCKQLNGPRAAAWLKTQIATSPVYTAHGQLLFQYEWQNRNPLTSQYLADQIANASTYSSQIAAQTQLSISDINTNVVTDPSDPDLITDLIAQVNNASTYATDNNLYWAFYYYTYNTAPGILANIGLQMSMNTGSTDGTTLTRLLQQNIAVLTALDPSGFFARQYTQTINTFLATNILPSMFDFLGNSSSFDVISLYLQQFVTNNLSNEDQQIAAAAAQIQSILQGEDSDQLIEGSITALRTIAGTIQSTLSLPYVSQTFLTWLNTNYPNLATAGSFFGSLLIGGVACLGVFNLFTEFKDWDQLSDGQKAQVVGAASLMGLQIVAAVVKRGVRIYAIFEVDGLSTAQRVAAISQITGSGEAGVLDQGLLKIGNTTARWLGDTQGVLGRAAVGDSGPTTAVLVNATDATAEETNLLTTMFGRSLEEFMATRLGPVFILAGVGISIYYIAKGAAGLSLASDIVGIVSGGLTLFATVGGWFVTAQYIAVDGLLAGMISVAGPLAILAALAGVGLLIWQMLKKPPNPVQEFVDNYAKPAGLALSSTASSIDYATPYSDPSVQDGLMMIGFNLSANQQSLLANSDGSISLGSPTYLPNCVWVPQTDGLGMSQIHTMIQPDTANPPVTVFLSLMSDSSVSFQPAEVSPPPPGPTVITQTWLSAPVGNATVTRAGNLVSMQLTLQPVMPDNQGNFAPSQAQGWLAQTNQGVSISQSAPTTFTLTMSGMAPNYMQMANMEFPLNSTPSTQQVYGPSFGIPPSTPFSFVLNGTLPPFLVFSNQTGTFTPNGTEASSAFQESDSIFAQNACGSGTASFQVSVSAVSSSLAIPMRAMA